MAAVAIKIRLEFRIMTAIVHCLGHCDQKEKPNMTFMIEVVLVFVTTVTNLARIYLLSICFTFDFL
jgi:hypothetical protein